MFRTGCVASARKWIASSLSLLAMTATYASALFGVMRPEAIRSFLVFERSEAIHGHIRKEDGSIRCPRNESNYKHAAHSRSANAPEWCMNFSALREKGRGECRVLDAPAV